MLYLVYIFFKYIVLPQFVGKPVYDVYCVSHKSLQISYSINVISTTYFSCHSLSFPFSISLVHALSFVLTLSDHKSHAVQFWAEEGHRKKLWEKAKDTCTVLALPSHMLPPPPLPPLTHPHMPLPLSQPPHSLHSSAPVTSAPHCLTGWSRASSMCGKRKEANRTRGKKKNGFNLSANNGQLESPTPNPSQQRTLASAADSPPSQPHTLPTKSLTVSVQLFSCCSKLHYTVKPLK